MSIWSYNDSVQNKEVIISVIDETKCVFCNTPLNTLKDERDEEVLVNRRYTENRIAKVCPMCGWWIVSRFSSHGLEETMTVNTTFGACGSLRSLDIRDQSLPISEIRAYLAAKYDSRFQIDPWKFEETIASVYKDLGFRARVTAKSGDGGVDVILDGPDDIVIGIQVKRYKDKIKVEQIRSFAGALMLKGITRGIFITTSDFQSGAAKTARKFMRPPIGIPIELKLVDAKRFYEALGIAQRKAYETISDPSAPFTSATLLPLHQHSKGWLAP